MTLTKYEAVVKRFSLACVVCVIFAAVASGQRARSSPPLGFETADPACQSRTLVSTGGQFPRQRRTLAIRWTGYSNFEIAYNNQIILLDAYFDRGSTHPPLGFRAADVRKADLILIGHGHSDHMSDAAAVGIATGATVVGAPLTIEKLKTQSVDQKQLRTVTGRGGETLSFDGFTVEPILARHGEPPADVQGAFRKAVQGSVAAPSTQQAAEQAAIAAKGTNDPKVVTEGTIAYLITLDGGFTILYRDSGGKVTEYERVAASRAGPVDLILAPTAASYVTGLVVEQALEYVRTYKPRVFMPAHHDAPYNDLWRPTEPIFQAIKDQNPGIVTISKGYREATCFDTGSAPRRRAQRSR